MNQERPSEVRDGNIPDRTHAGGEQIEPGAPSELKPGQEKDKAPSQPVGAVGTADGVNKPSVATPSSPAVGEGAGTTSSEVNSLADKEDAIKEREAAKLALQVDEYYNSSYRRARIWMTLYVVFLCFELLLAVAFVLLLTLNYRRELLPADTPAGNLITHWNVGLFIGAIFLINLLIILAANFNKRWRLNQSTLKRLAALKVDLTDSKLDLAGIRTTLKDILDDYNQGLQKQKVLWGPEVK